MERRTLTRDDESAMTQRVRIGLTGLACVFLLVLLAAAVFGFVGDESSAPPAGAPANGMTNTDVSDDAPKEPLAELGVAPGNAPDHPVANDSVTVRTARSRATTPPAR